MSAVSEIPQLVVSENKKANAPLGLTARYREKPEYFFVDEILGFTPEGEGEHVLLHVEKIGQNTHWVAEQIAKFCGVKPMDIGNCGRKDRHAVTRQWFSFYDPHRKMLDWESLSIEGVKLLEVTRHVRKLRPGYHEANAFVIRLTNVLLNNQAIDVQQQPELLKEITHRLSSIPNYYGPQRFGRDNSNLQAALDWFQGGRKPHPKRRSMIISAARSFLFNQVLSQRVEQGDWLNLIDGDVPELDKPTGPLWGRGRSLAQAESLALETEALAPYQTWCNGLEHCGLQQERRSLVLTPKRLSIEWIDNDLQIAFWLPVGCFATTVLSEAFHPIVDSSFSDQ